MELKIKNKLSENLYRNVPGSSGYQDVQDSRIGPALKSSFSGSNPLFENEFKQLLVKTGKEVEKRTQLLSHLNRSVSEFLTVIEPGDMDSNPRPQL